jgi:hypothetical protein
MRKSMQHLITIRETQYLINEYSSEYDMRNTCPKFFVTPHGNRETFTVYRGQLIVRNTVQFTGCKPTRRTALYLYLVNCQNDNCVPDLLCVGWPSSIRKTKRLIDEIITRGFVPLIKDTTL